MEKKYFMWYDSGRLKCPRYGPHYCDDIDKIGEKLYHTLDELLKMHTPSDSLKKKMIGAKLETRIKMHRLHSNGDLMIRRIDEKQVELLDELQKNYNERQILEKKLKEFEKIGDSLCSIIMK